MCTIKNKFCIWAKWPSDYPPAFHQASLKIAGTYLYYWVERDTVQEKYFALEHDSLTWPGVALR